MNFKNVRSLVSMVLVITSLLTACGGNTTTVEDKVIMMDWAYGQMKLAPGVTVVRPDGVEFIGQDGQIIRASNIPTDEWITIRKNNPDGGWFTIVSPKGVQSRLRLVKLGDKECPDWAIGLYTMCEIADLRVKGN
jgi:hypothetical protein